MSRLRPLQDPEMSPAQLEFAQAVRTRRGAAGATAVLLWPTEGLSGPYEALLRSPDLGVRYRELAAWAFGVTSMPRDLIEFAILVLVKHWNAQYPFWAHVLLGRQAGLSNEVMEAIRTGEPIPFKDANQQLVYEFLLEYLARNRVSESAYAALRDVFGESAVVDLVGLMGVYATTAMIANVFEAPVPEGEDDPMLDPASA